MANTDKMVCVKNGKVFFVDDDTMKKENNAKANDSVKENTGVNDKIRKLEKKVDKLLEQSKPEDKELTEIVETLNKIPNQGGGGTCTMHSTIKI